MAARKTESHRLRLFSAACCAGCLALMAHAGLPAPVEVAADAGQVPVWQALRIVEGVDRPLTPDQAAQLMADGDATGVDSPYRTHGRGTVPHWAAFSLRNPEPSELLRLLAVETTTQHDIRLFERDGAGHWRQIRSVADNAEGRIGGGTNSPVWELHLAPRKLTELLLRIEGPAIVRFPVYVYHPLHFAERQGNTRIAIGIALGTCLIIVIYIGSLRRYLEDRSVALFIGMLGADLVGALWLSGFLSTMFPAVPERTLSSIGFAAYAALFGCGSLHARIYLDTAGWAPRIDRLLQWLAWFCIALAPWFPLAFPAAARVFLTVAGAAVPLALVLVSTLASRRQVPFSRFIAAAWLAYFLSGGTFLLARVVDDPRLWSPNTLPLGQATVVAMLFGLAMSQRLTHLRDALMMARQEVVLRREQEVAQMRERSLLFAATNHDLRQPLFGISLFADLLTSARTPEERAQHSLKLNLALKEVDDLLVSIQQLASVHEASHRPTLKTVKLDALLLPLVEEYRGRSQYKRLAIRYVPSRLTIRTHAPYFQRIVRNALSNAVRYTDPGGRILVGCRRGGGLRLVIVDSGGGMTREQTQRAFDAFQRFDAEGSISEGFGLGLFSTKSLANALDQTVSLHSHNGRGTEFRLLLSPAGPPADASA